MAVNGQTLSVLAGGGPVLFAGLDQGLFAGSLLEQFRSQFIAVVLVELASS